MTPLVRTPGGALKNSARPDVQPKSGATVQVKPQSVSLTRDSFAVVSGRIKDTYRSLSRGLGAVDYTLVMGISDRKHPIKRALTRLRAAVRDTRGMGTPSEEVSVMARSITWRVKTVSSYEKGVIPRWLG